MKINQKIRPAKKNLEEILKQSEVHILYWGNKPPYVGSAGADRLQELINV